MSEKAKLFSSLHNHTTFCDGRDDIETMCRAAFENKLYAVGFSSHSPIYKKTGIKTEWNMRDDRLDEYVSEVLAAKKRWHGKLEVFLGLEVDYIKGKRCANDSDIKAINADYLIGSVHYLVPANGAMPFTVDGPFEEFEKGLNEGFNGNAEALMHSYYDTMTEMISIGGFDILGHADILKKNCENKNYWTKEIEEERQKEIAHIAAQAGIAVEVNTGGLNRKKINDLYPSVSFLRNFCECDVPVIITADAHCSAHIAGNYEKAIQAIIYAGFKKHVIFFGKNNEKSLWREEKLQ